jgi:hypothetical protein
MTHSESLFPAMFAAYVAAHSSTGRSEPTVTEHPVIYVPQYEDEFVPRNRAERRKSKFKKEGGITP